PPADREAQIITQESGVPTDTAHALVALAHKLRALQDRGLAEVPSTRLLVATAHLIARGIPIKRACQVALVSALSDDASLLAAMNDLVDLTFPCLPGDNMAEAEDVITDAARHATIYARDLWQRHRGKPDVPRPLGLADVVHRLDLLIG